MNEDEIENIRDEVDDIKSDMDTIEESVLALENHHSGTQLSLGRLWDENEKKEEKLKELEKKIKNEISHNEHHYAHLYMENNKLEEKLKELEKWKQEHLQELHGIINGYMDSINKEIDEIKTKWKDFNAVPLDLFNGTEKEMNEKLEEVEQRFPKLYEIFYKERYKKNQEIEQLKAVLRDLINILGSKTIGEEEILYYREHKELFDKLGSEDTAPACPTCKHYIDSGEELVEFKPKTYYSELDYAPGIYYRRSVRCSLGKPLINNGCWKEKEPSKEISKNVVFPTKLSFQEQYPQTSNYKTPEYIENLRKEKEPSEVKKCPKCGKIMRDQRLKGNYLCAECYEEESPAEDKDYGIIECSDKICEEMLNDCRKELIAEILEDLKDFWEIVRAFTMSQYDVKAKYKFILDKWEARKNQ